MNIKKCLKFQKEKQLNGTEKKDEARGKLTELTNAAASCVSYSLCLDKYGCILILKKSCPAEIQLTSQIIKPTVATRATAHRSKEILSLTNMGLKFLFLYCLTLKLLSFSEDVSSSSSNIYPISYQQYQKTIHVKSLAQCLAQDNHLRNTVIIVIIKDVKTFF